MNAADRIILSEHCYDSVIGCAAVSLKKELVVIDNAMNGFTLYPLDREDPIRYFVTEPQSVPIPKQVAFGEESKIIVGGSDNGSVYLFERRTGQMLAKLAHSKTGLVQTITVWTHQYTSYKSTARPERQQVLKSTIFTFLLVLGVLGFGLQTVWLKLLLEKENLLGAMLIHIPQVTYWCSRLPVQKPVHVLTPPPLPVDLSDMESDMEMLKELAMQLVDLAKGAHKIDYEGASEDATRDWPSGYKEMTNMVVEDLSDRVDPNVEKSVIIYL
ncbi:hypothetical protein EDD16DRAFT_1517372 [Pisolithus croceorrhizus]|nr:hypothetical protein EDD16DRAFT_1517372 [Pisolithus croceorrhizus]